MANGQVGGGIKDEPHKPPYPMSGRSLATKIRLGVLLGLVLVLFAPPDVASLHRAGAQILGGARGTDPAMVPRSGTQPSTDATAGAADQARPDRSASGPEAAVRNRITEALGRQAAALRVGDLDGFLSVADPGDAAVRGELTRRFTSLQAMRVAGWDETVADTVTPAGEGAWSAPVRLRYCFAVTGCTPVPVTVETRWSTGGGRLRLTAFGTSPAAQTGPRPWEVSELRATVGNRVVVAGTGRWAGRLPGALAAAERAAAVTDRYARWGDPPDRYVVYLAGPDEWSQWYGVQQSPWVAAYAMPLTDTYTEIVLNATKVGPDDTREVLQHEFTHVVTLSGVRRTYPNSWWLVEGVAEYVQNAGQPLWAYRSLGEGRAYLRSGAWNGSIALDEPDPKATGSEANGHYAVAYLAVRWLVETYGEARTLAFFAAVARNGTGLEAAAASALGQSWAQVADGGARYVRRALGGGRR